MNFRRGAIFIMFLLIIAIMLIVADRFFGRDNTEIPQIAIVNLGPYPIMDKIKNEAEAHLQAKLKDEAKIKVFDANFQQEAVRSIANQILSSDYSMIITITTPVTQLFLGRTERTAPVVFTFVSSPESIGYSGPGSLENATGFFDSVPVKDTVDLINALMIGTKTIGFIVNDGEPSASSAYKKFQEVTDQSDEINLVKIPVSSAAEIRTAVTARSSIVDAFLFGPDSLVTSNVETVVNIANSKKIPVFCTEPISVERGCLAAISPNYGGMGRAAGDYAIRILRGANPENLPVEFFEDFEGHWNEQQAEALGFERPNNMR